MIYGKRFHLGVLPISAMAIWLGTTGIASADYSTTVLTDAPVAYWRLGEASTRDTAANLGSAGASANGTYTPGVGVGVAGLISGSDTAIRIAAGSSDRMSTAGFEKFSGGSGFSVEFWVKFETTPTGFMNLVGDGEGAGNLSTDFNLMVYATPGGAIRAHAQTTSGLDVIDSVQRFDLGTTHFIVSTWDSGTGGLNLYIDGSLAAVTQSGINPLTGSPINTDNPAFVGRDNREGNNATMILDEAAIYNRALTPSQIASHYQAGISAVPEPSSVILLGIGICGLLARMRRHR